MQYDEDTLSWYNDMDVELQRIFDFIAPYSSDTAGDALSAAMDYTPAKCLEYLLFLAAVHDVQIPKSLIDDVEQLIERDGYIEDWRRKSIDLFKQQYYAEI